MFVDDDVRVKHVKNPFKLPKHAIPPQVHWQMKLKFLLIIHTIRTRERRRKVCWFWNFLFTTEVESTENQWKKNVYFFSCFYFSFFFFVDQQRKSCFFSLLPWSLQSSDKRFESKNSFLTKKCLFRKVYGRCCDVSTNMALSHLYQKRSTNNSKQIVLYFVGICAEKHTHSHFFSKIIHFRNDSIITSTKTHLQDDISLSLACLVGESNNHWRWWWWWLWLLDDEDDMWSEKSFQLRKFFFSTKKKFFLL